MTNVIPFPVNNELFKSAQSDLEFKSTLRDIVDAGFDLSRTTSAQRFGLRVLSMAEWRRQSRGIHVMDWMVDLGLPESLFVDLVDHWVLALDPEDVHDNMLLRLDGETWKSTILTRYRVNSPRDRNGFPEVLASIRESPLAFDEALHALWLECCGLMVSDLAREVADEMDLPIDDHAVADMVTTAARASSVEMVWAMTHDALLAIKNFVPRGPMRDFQALSNAGITERLNTRLRHNLTRHAQGWLPISPKHIPKSHIRSPAMRLFKDCFGLDESMSPQDAITVIGRQASDMPAHGCYHNALSDRDSTAKTLSAIVEQVTGMDRLPEFFIALERELQTASVERAWENAAKSVCS